MAISDIDLASLMCSRLCHDLLNPVGSITNGLELLADEKDPEMRARCMELLAESAHVSAQKLKFYRLAFGAAGGFGESVDVREAEALITGMLPANGRVKLVWAVSSDSLPKTTVKVLLNLAHIAMTALVRGGELTVGAERHADATEIVVRASGDKIILDETTGRALTGTLADVDVSPRNAAAYMVEKIVTASGGVVQLVADGGVLVLGTMLEDI